MSAVPFSQIVGFEQGEVSLFQLKDSVFVSLYDNKSAKGWAAHFREHELTGTKFTEHLDHLSQNSQEFTVKIVGPEKLCQLVTQALAKYHAPLPTVVANPHSIQVLFYPKTGRVRVEKTPENLRAKVQSSQRLRILIVDDSPTIRDLLAKIFARDPSLEVVGSTGKPLEVLSLVESLRPDVITMDIHMPDMDGCTLVKKIMAAIPTPTVMISSVSMEEGPAVLTALEYGAVDYIQKPSLKEITTMSPVIIEKIKGAAKANLSTASKSPSSPKSSYANAQSQLDQNCLIAIGSSTGGTQALQHLLLELPSEIPPIVIVQHIPPVFSAAFAKRLDSLCPFDVKEAQHGDTVEPGKVLVAPGGKQMEVENRGGRLVVAVTDAPPVNRHKPSVDVLFDSVANQVKGRKVGVILTGMGSDGAKGLLGLRKAGAHTIAQSEKTCVVFGMPREAIEIGAAEVTLDLEAIAAHLTRHLARESLNGKT